MYKGAGEEIKPYNYDLNFYASATPSPFRITNLVFVQNVFFINVEFWGYSSHGICII